MKTTPSPLRILAAGAAWRLFGARQSADLLLAAVAGDNEQNRMLAGMSLVKAGQRSFRLIEDKLDRGEASSAALRLLPDIDGPASRKVMDRVVECGPSELHDTARQCIELLDRIDTSNQ